MYTTPTSPQVQDSIPVAYSNGRAGGWQVETGEAVAFTSMAGSGKAEAQFLIGDFDGDGKADVAAFTPGQAGLSFPVAFSNGRGQWTVTQAGHTAAADKTVAMVGDYDGDGKDDVLLVGPDSKGFVTVMYSAGRQGWSVKQEKVGNWANQALEEGVRRLVGDYDGDGRADVCLVGGAGWNDAYYLFGKDSQAGFDAVTQNGGQFAGQVRRRGSERGGEREIVRQRERWG